MDTSTQATELITVKGQSGTRPKRQYRPIEEKRRIVEETLVEGASVARVALSHGVNANQVFGWRKLYLAGQLSSASRAIKLLPVHVSENSPSLAPTTHRECSPIRRVGEVDAGHHSRGTAPRPGSHRRQC